MSYEESEERRETINEYFKNILRKQPRAKAITERDPETIDRLFCEKLYDKLTGRNYHNLKHMLSESCCDKRGNQVTGDSLLRGFTKMNMCINDKEREPLLTYYHVDNGKSVSVEAFSIQLVKKIFPLGKFEICYLLFHCDPPPFLSLIVCVSHTRLSFVTGMLFKCDTEHAKQGWVCACEHTHTRGTQTDRHR